MGWREGREGEDREIETKSEKKTCGYILFYCGGYIILLCYLSFVYIKRI